MASKPNRNSFRNYACTNYELMPLVIEVPFGQTMSATAEEARQVLANYDYVYCFDADEQLIANYGELFAKKDEIAGRSLYRVIQSENGIILEAVF